MSQEQYEMQARDDSPQDTSARPKAPVSPVAPPQPRPVSARSSITAREPITRPNSTSIYPLVVVTFYTILALLSWIFFCVLNKRPILGGFKSYEAATTYLNKGWIQDNERYITVARILHTIVALLTIPVTSAICSMAAVAYLQVGNLRQSLTLTQVMALADQQWASMFFLHRIPQTYSLPLLLAFVLTIIGSASQILQSSFIGYETIKTATKSARFPYIGVEIKDIPDMFEYAPKTDYVTIFNLRNLLNTASGYDFDSNLWNVQAIPERRTLELLTRNENLSDMDEWVSTSFFSELPSNFSTGTVSGMYVPRINSTTNVTEISQGEFSSSCSNETDSGGFFARYEREMQWAEDIKVTACMVGDKRISPWKPTRDRQDIQEELYVSKESYGLSTEAYYKVTTKTSLGYFELPSYQNGGQPGPLLDKDPIGSDKKQTSRYKPEPKHYVKRDVENNITSAGNDTLGFTPNLGPLTALAIALFGKDSTVEKSMRDGTVSRPEEHAYMGLCVAPLPLGYFMNTVCIRDSSSRTRVTDYINSWVDNLIGDSSTQIGPLNAGIYLANKAWLGTMNSGAANKRFLQVNYDLGTDVRKPKIALVPMIICSVFLGLHLIGLWVLAIFAVKTKPFIKTLGAELMLRMGTAYADVLYTAEGREWKRTTDMLPGYVGDGNPDAPEGKIQVGAFTSLRSRRKYEMLR